LDLRTGWRERATSWIRWARDPDLDDDFWVFHLPRFLEFVPPPGTHTLDVAAGEGRLTRELQKLGHRIVGVDSSFALTQAAANHPQAAPAIVGDASRLPLADGSVDLVVAFMCLHDFDELESAIAEVHRVLASGGKVVVALLHPVVTGALAGAYDAEAPYESLVERAGLTMNYRGRHRPMGRYLSALAEQGFGLDSVREVADPRTAPPTVKFLHIAATRK
jgi:SAM-dependent methyltransferase